MLITEQLLARKKGLGGSDLAAIAGLSTYKTAVDVYLDKIGESLEQSEETEAQWWGTEKEPSIVKRYEIKTGKVCSVEPNLIIHPEYYWMIGNVDRRILADNAILECKTAHEFLSKEWGEPGSDVIPEAYLLQCIHYAIITNASYVDLAVLIGSADFRIYKYERNATLEKMIIDMERRFWHENVLKRIPPPVKSTEEAAALWPIHKPDTKFIANDYLAEQHANLITAEKEIKTLEATRDSLKALLQENMQENERLIDFNGSTLATWKTQTANRIDVDRLKKEQPIIAAQYVKQSSSRVFRINRSEAR